MIVLNQRYFGQLARCSCGAVIGFSPDEVSRASTIRCPVCTNLINVLFDPTYDGVVKENNDGNGMVQEQSGAGKSNCGS